MQHTKCSLDIYSTTLLALGKWRTLWCIRVGDCLHKYQPSLIYAIGYIVSFGVWLAMYLIVVLRSIALSKSREHWRVLHHIYVNVRSRHAEEGVPNTQVIICHNFKDHTATCARIWLVSNLFGALKYVGPNTATTALQNLYMASMVVDSAMWR
jgi:hypothetical protein